MVTEHTTMATDPGDHDVFPDATTASGTHIFHTYENTQLVSMTWTPNDFAINTSCYTMGLSIQYCTYGEYIQNVTKINTTGLSTQLIIQGYFAQTTLL